MKIPYSKMCRVFRDPRGLIRVTKRFFAMWNPGILDPGGRRWKTKYVSVPLYRTLGAVIPTFKNSEFSSFFGEHEYIFEWIAKNGSDFVIVDIGAGDGISQSNVAKSIYYYRLDAILVEGNGLKFSQLALNYQTYDNVSLVKSFVTRDNVAGLIDSSRLNGANYVLSLDIDSYDLYVMESILLINPPALVCLEWNPLFRPPVEFSVTPNYTTGWRGDWFWGASIESWNQMLNRFDYGITTVLGVSFFAEPRSSGRRFLTSDEVYKVYFEQVNRLAVPGETDGTSNFNNSKYIRSLLDEYPNLFTTNLLL